MNNYSSKLADCQVPSFFQGGDLGVVLNSFTERLTFARNNIQKRLSFIFLLTEVLLLIRTSLKPPCRATSLLEKEGKEAFLGTKLALEITEHKSKNISAIKEKSLTFQLQPQSGTNTATISGPSINTVATDVDISVAADTRSGSSIIAGRTKPPPV